MSQDQLHAFLTKVRLPELQMDAEFLLQSCLVDRYYNLVE